MIDITGANALFLSSFPKAQTRYFYSHGRLEILGNHTDHNHGLCLVSGVDLGITACVAPRDDGIVSIISQGYRPFFFPISDLSPSPRDRSSTRGLTRGVLAGMKKLGFKIGGFSAALVSDIPAGSGVSSSACYESLIAHIVDVLYNGKILAPLAMAKIGQFAENDYFGKPCGLLDQIGTSFGGMCYLDFGGLDGVHVEQVPFSLPLDITLVNTPSSHAGLNDLYASIPADMKAVARNVFGKETLREVNKADFARGICQPSIGVSERAKLRAQHFFDENERVKDAFASLRSGNVVSFLEDVRRSEASSEALLANTMVPGRYENSPQEAVDRANKILKNGACRIMGGGFAGSILAFTPHDETESFRAAMAAYYGKENVYPAAIFEGGPIVIGA